MVLAHNKKGKDMKYPAAAVKRYCPICGNKMGNKLCDISFSSIDQENLPLHFDVVSCANCQFVFDDLAITQQDLDDYYTHTIKYHHPDTCGSGGFSPASLARYAHVVELCKKYLSGCQSFLDIGAGKGGLLQTVMKACGDQGQYVAVEPSMALVKEYGGVRFYPFLDELLAQNAQYDFVFCTHVLEHVYDLSDFIEKIGKVLSDGKYAYIEVPNAAAYIIGQKAPYYYFDREHINHFTPTSLKNLFSFHGFELVFSEDAANIGMILRKSTAGKHSSCVDSDEDFTKIVAYVEQSKSLENSNYYDDISFPVICWGMGAHLRRVFSKPAFPRPVSAIIDRDRGGHGESWQGIPLVTADILREEQYAQSTVLITSVLYADEIKHQLANMGFRGKVLTAF